MTINKFHFISFADDMGCAVDVLSILDAACSNKEACEYYIPTPELLDVICSSRAMASVYLEAEYQCFFGKYCVQHDSSKILKQYYQFCMNRSAPDCFS